MQVWKLERGNAAAYTPNGLGLVPDLGKNVSLFADFLFSLLILQKTYMCSLVKFNLSYSAMKNQASCPSKTPEFHVN